MHSALFTTLLASAIALSSATKGVVTLDDLTFDKIVDGSKPILVKFDKQYSYGDAEDAFKETAEKLGELKTDLVIAEVGKQEYGDEENKALHERFSIDKDEWPVYKLFPKGGGDPIDGPKKADGSKDDQKAALGSFLKVNTGVNTFMGKGQISKFDDLAEKLMKGDKDAVAEAEKLLEDKEVVADDEDKSNAEYYIKTMKRVGERGAEYPKTEITRLKAMVNDKISEKKKEMFSKRINILSSFAAP